MPLVHGKSKEAFVHNIKAELKAGKPMAQSLAIAYNTKRRGKKMSKGGEVDSNEPQKLDMVSSINKFVHRDEPKKDEMPKEYAHGGMVEHEEDLYEPKEPSRHIMQHGYDPDEIAKEIHERKFAKGGMVEGDAGDADYDGDKMEDLEPSDDFLTAGAPPEPRMSAVNDTSEDYERSHEIEGDEKMKRRKMLDSIMGMSRK